MDTKGKASSTVSWVLFGLIKPSNVQLKENMYHETQPYFSSAYFTIAIAR